MELQREQLGRQGGRAEERTARRARRSDYGSFRVSERDTELLYLVGEQYALTLPQLAHLIGRSPHTARALRDRWKRAGWIGSGKLAVQAPLDKRVTAHTLRHTAATWLRQETGDARLVAAYLGHADLSTVSRYAHVAEEELHQAAAAVAARSGLTCLPMSELAA
jgi:integrase